MSTKIYIEKNANAQVYLDFEGYTMGDYACKYLSIIGSSSNVKLFLNEFKKPTGFYYRGTTYGRRISHNTAFDGIMMHIPGTDYCHAIMWEKDRVTDHYSFENNELQAVVYVEYTPHEDAETCFEEKEVKDAIYEKLCKLSPIPIKNEWMDYILPLITSHINICHCDGVTTRIDGKRRAVLFIKIIFSRLLLVIAEGLKSGKIKISEESNSVSKTMAEMENIDDYLLNFKDTLAPKIQNAFVPRFNPSKDKYSKSVENACQYAAYMGKANPYPAQKAVIQSVVNSLDHKPTSIIVGETGVGKTLMSTLSAFAHNADRKTMTNIVMCPGHLVKKWRREIARIAPLSTPIIVENYEHMIELMPMINDKNRKRHLWLIMSKETAKSDYVEHPAAVWGLAGTDFARRTGSDPDGNYRSTLVTTSMKYTYLCPHCGKPLYTEKKVGTGRYAFKEKIYYDEFSFSKKTQTNGTCIHCGEKLWSANSKEQTRWVNLGGSAGWIERARMPRLFERLSAADTLSSKESAVLRAIVKAMNGDIPAQRAPKRYPIGKFVKKFLKGKIDYFLVDEMHELKGASSLQANAFGAILSAARHTICFTGTLLNGYASGIYFLLFRCFPKLMKEHGFEFSTAGETQFARKYGVYQVTKTTVRYSTSIRNEDTTKTKNLPGVSPLVFTNFLLENAAFISLEDIGTGLPGYQTIPVGVDMADSLGDGYAELENAVRNTIGTGNQKNSRILSQLMRTLTVYPDYPFEKKDIVNAETGEIILSSREIKDDVLLPKEEKFIELVQEKVSNGEKVLVYCQWPNMTSISKRIPELLNTRNIKTCLLEASGDEEKVSPSEREAWIQKQIDNGMQVLVCSPDLVKTGLDLLDFTTIIWYQVGYDLFTLRQASRRSWRLTQTKDVEVYFMYYTNSIQETILRLMATKLDAAMAVEGKFSQEGLNAMSNNQDVLTQLAASVADGIKESVNVEVFKKARIVSTQDEDNQIKERRIDMPVVNTGEKALESLRMSIKKCATRKPKKRIPHEHFEMFDAEELFAAI